MRERAGARGNATPKILAYGYSAASGIAFGCGMGTSLISASFLPKCASTIGITLVVNCSIEPMTARLGTSPTAK
ncbi:hypothetical protein D3C83_195690 [compost metagenome]